MPLGLNQVAINTNYKPYSIFEGIMTSLEQNLSIESQQQLLCIIIVTLKA